jgi:prepilin-type N-terminal cleavage/methylation domain-containing protein
MAVRHRGITLIELIVASVLMLIALTIAYSCLVPAFGNFARTQEDSVLVSNVLLASRTMSREIKYGTTAGVVIIPSTYINPQDGKSYPSYAIAFCSVLDKNGGYLWDADGNPQWQKVGVFYLEAPAGNLYYQEDFVSPSATMTIPGNTYTPRHGGAHSDRLIARNIQQLFFTDCSGAQGVTAPLGKYIRVSIVGMRDGRTYSTETSINTERSR